MRTRLSAVAALAIGAVLLGCGGAEASDDAGVLRVTSAPISVPQHLAPFTAEQVAAARATCAAPHGDVDPITSAGDVARKVVGAWLLCDPLSGGWIAKELRPDGSFAVLEDDGAGGLVAARGVLRTGHWELRGYDDQLHRSTAGDAIWYLDQYCGECAASGAPAFEKEPTRMFGHRWGGMGEWVRLTK